jgi:hypothetical protein
MLPERSLTLPPTSQRLRSAVLRYGAFAGYISFYQHLHNSSHLKSNRMLPSPDRDNSEISPAQRAGNVVPTESVLTGRRKSKCANIKMNCYRFNAWQIGDRRSRGQCQTASMPPFSFKYPAAIARV